MSYSHLTIIELAKIEMLDDLKFSIWDIAKELKRNPSTILRELARIPDKGSYCAVSAQEAYRQKKKHRGVKANAQRRNAISFNRN